MKQYTEIFVGFVVLLVLVSSADAIKITQAEVQGGLAVVEGKKAVRDATITWEDAPVTAANHGGNFSFSGIVPPDCVGTLSDGVNTIEVAVDGCTPPTSGFLATGQTIAYQADKNDGIAGAVDVPDDGTIQTGAPLSYTDNEDGTITDNNTGLMWEKKLAANGSDGGNCVAPDQVDRDLHCVNNRYRWIGDGSQDTIWDWLDDVNTEGGTGFAGFDDWRIPNVKVLQSIVDYERESPSIDPILRPAAVDDYWASTTRIGNPPDAWRVGFGTGNVFSDRKTDDRPVRAVRGGL